MKERLLTEKQTLKYLSISKYTLYNLVNAGDIKKVIMGPKTTRYDKNDLDAFIHNQISKIEVQK